MISRVLRLAPACLLSLSLAGAPAEAARAPLSVAYCQKIAPRGIVSFAARQRPDGDLDFGLSNWTPEGNHAGITGVARRHGGEWVYRSMDWSSEPGRPCVAHIRIGRSGVRITAEPLDSCDGNQGNGATIGDIRLHASAYAGPSPKDPTDIAESYLGPKCDL